MDNEVIEAVQKMKGETIEERTMAYIRDRVISHDEHGLDLNVALSDIAESLRAIGL